MNTPYLGTILLSGDIENRKFMWSYALYNGHYYFLEPDRLYDLETHTYYYSMIRDMWADLLMMKPHVRGTLRRTNDRRALENFFHLTSPLIDNATKVTYIPLGDYVKNEITVEGINTAK